MNLRSIASLAVCASLLILSGTIGSAAGPDQARNDHQSVVSSALTRAEAAARIKALLLRPDARLGAIRRLTMYHTAPTMPPKKVGVAGWVIDGFGYLWGTNKAGDVLTYHNDCVEPGLGRVDHKGNLLVACMVGGETNGVPGNVNVYAAGNTSAPADIVLTDASGYVPVDTFEDNAGNIYAVNAVQYVCGQSGCNANAGDVVRWSVGNQKTGALPDKTYSDANLFQFESADIDASGTIYVDGFTAAGSSEVDSLSRRSVTDLNISLAYAGGVYVVSPNGSAPVLSILDQIGSTSPTLYQFSLPISPNASPIVVDVTPQDFEKRCDPIGAGYNSDGAEASLGLVGCKANAKGAPSTGRWKVRQKLDYVQPNEGLFVPSDK